MHTYTHTHAHLRLGSFGDVLADDLLGANLHVVGAGDVFEVLRLQPEQEVLLCVPVDDEDEVCGGDDDNNDGGDGCV
jgi:hypothetical protein